MESTQSHSKKGYQFCEKRMKGICGCGFPSLEERFIFCPLCGTKLNKIELFELQLAAMKTLEREKSKQPKVSVLSSGEFSEKLGKAISEGIEIPLKFLECNLPDNLHKALGIFDENQEIKIQDFIKFGFNPEFSFKWPFDEEEDGEGEIDPFATDTPFDEKTPF